IDPTVSREAAVAIDQRFPCEMLLYYGCFLPSCATFVKRGALEKAGLLDPEFKVTMDFEWYVRLARSGCVFAPLRQMLATFTWHDSNISATLVERRLFERRLVQDRYSNMRGPAWFRGVMYEILRNFWIAVRVIRRSIA
ncbi:MAG: hypothetical protein LC121_25940, partial [Anaerolineae bacterium]|nr:hypothetical protein [Anaerolineae bacterium]